MFRPLRYVKIWSITREVAEYYAQVFGLEAPTFLTFGSMPPNPDHPLPPGAEDLIMHAKLTVVGSELMFSDVFPGMPFQPGNNITIAYVGEDEDALRSAFHKLEEGGTVDMELQATAWSSCFGMLKDKYGIGWQFSLAGE